MRECMAWLDYYSYYSKNQVIFVSEKFTRYYAVIGEDGGKEIRNCKKNYSFFIFFTNNFVEY